MRAPPDNFNRRSFIQSLIVFPAMLGLSACSEAKVANPYLCVSAASNSASEHGIGLIDHLGSMHQHILTGFRGHAAIQNPSRRNRMVLIGRRPSTQAVEFDLQNGQIIRIFEAKKDRHFFGHGVFSFDGNLFYTTENDLASGQGRIVVRDTRQYDVIGEFPSYGIGPHEIKLMPDAQTLVVANGGILTHPDTGRSKLNLDQMKSSLVFVNRNSGKLLSRSTVDESKSSIRHIDVSKDGSIAIAMQVQREAISHEKPIALAAIQHAGAPLQLLQDTNAISRHLNDYLGSVAINSKNGIVGFTSPRGNLAVFWNIEDKQLVGYHKLFDVCGIAVTPDQRYFVLSNSNGQIRYLDADTLKENKFLRVNVANMSWDNHLSLAII